MGIFDSVSNLASSAKDGIVGAASSAKNAVTGFAKDTVAYARAKKLEADTFAEKKALLAWFIPESVVAWYQSERSALGIDPPDALTMLPILVFAVPLAFFFIISQLLSQGSKMLSITANVATGKKTTEGQAIFFIICSLVIFAIVLFVVFFWKGPGTKAIRDLRSVQGSIGAKVGFQNKQTVSESAYMLVNIQPLSIKQTGFVGPAENDGSFDPEMSIQTAIRSGVKFFTLQIDYLEREQDENFEPINVPTLVYRDSAGKLISSNGATIKSVATQLANYAFSPDLGVSNYPIIVYLHFVRAPDPLKKPDAYLDFMKKVSESLEPIHPHILKIPGDNFTRQQSEATLLKVPLPSITNKIILLCNADTTIFRNSTATGGAVPPISDLDSFINMRVYAYKSADRLGLTQTTDAKANAILISYELLKEMSEPDKAAFAMKGKNRFVIAMPAPLENPTESEIKSLLADTGVNAIPLNLIGDDPAPINKLINIWSSAKPYYLVKPMMLQSYTTAVNPNES